MKKSIGIISGLAFLYVGVYFFLGINSNNMAYKENNFISKTFASIKVFENSGNNTEYYTGSSDLVDNEWSSSEYPNGTYKKVSIIKIVDGDPTPVSESIQTVISNIYRHSH